MKQMIIILLLCVLNQLGWASDQRLLPEDPWRAIVEMTKYSPNNRWEDNISVKLLGNCTHQDSVMVVNAIETLNGLTETIKLNLTSDDWGNLQVFFIDSTNYLKYQKLFNLQDKVNFNYTFTNKFSTPATPGLIAHFFLALKFSSVTDSARQNFVTNRLAQALFPVYWNNDKYFEEVLANTKAASIFMSTTPRSVNPFNSKLSQFDKDVIQTVYSNNFIELLPIAKNQYTKFRLPSWVRTYPHSILIFPFVLIIFLFIGLFILVYRKLFVRIKDKWAQFNVISAIALFFLGLLITLYISVADALRFHFGNFIIFDNFIVGTLTTLMLGLPAVNVIRLIEVIIHRKPQHKYFKVLLLFLSTSLIPSGTLLALTYVVTNKNIHEREIKVLLIGFLVFTIIGIIRALISFFILKEKELKIETEVKLANLRELKTKAELNALHSKINPHFLYNSLNSIAGLAKTDAKKTEHMALSLSKLFRYSINKEQSDWSTFAEEMEMVRIYLDIEKVRFDDRLEFTIDLPDELKTVKVPRFVIQPLVENAIKHGISNLVTKGEITASVHRVGQWIEIVVADNGPDFPAELNPGFGLQSIYDKLEIMYPQRFELHFVNSPNKHILIKLARYDHLPNNHYRR